MRPFPADLCACGRSHAGQQAREMWGCPGRCWIRRAGVADLEPL